MIEFLPTTEGILGFGKLCQILANVQIIVHTITQSLICTNKYKNMQKLQESEVQNEIKGKLIE